jgi:cytochrome c5
VQKIVVMATLTIIFGASWLGVNDTRGADYERGKTLFNEKCQLCHGVKGDGNGPAAAAYDPKPANFTDPKFWKDNPSRKITNAMKSGYRAMPPVDMKADEIKPIIDYMEHAFKK